MKPKVLLIEDDRTMVSLLSTLLEFEGYQVATVQNYSDLEFVMETVRCETPALILMDVNLRQINGIDLLKAIRHAPDSSQSTRIIMTSGIDVSERCLAYGADAFLLKPYMPGDLLNQIRLVLPG